MSLVRCLLLSVRGLGARGLGMPAGLLLLALLGLSSLGVARAQAPTDPYGADPPGRVGRVADAQGPVWWFDLEQGQWLEAQRNRPVTAGDRIATGRDARAEVRIGSTSFRLAEGTEVEWLRLDDDRVRVQLHRGSMAVRLRSRDIAAETEFGTDEAWFQPQRGGLYRLDRQDDTTWVGPWRGELRVMGEPGLAIDSGQRLQLWREGPQRQLRERPVAVLDDAFAAWVLRDDRAEERTASAAYVSPEMTGFEDLDRHGRWENHPEYGAVWFPTAVAVDWVPYRHGRWMWIRPWGWTWVDDAPWGFAPFHYGRWVTVRGRWCWVPGTYVSRPAYAPALVAWIGGPPLGIGIRVGAPALSWVPLAPWEVYHPHYRVSPGYHQRVNPPPDPRRRLPPTPRTSHAQQWANQAVPQAVTTWSSDRFAPPGRAPLPSARVDDTHRPPPPTVSRPPAREDATPRVQPPPLPLLQPPRAQPHPGQPQGPHGPQSPQTPHTQPAEPVQAPTQAPIQAPVRPPQADRPGAGTPVAPAPGADDRGPRRRFNDGPVDERPASRPAPRLEPRPEATPMPGPGSASPRPGQTAPILITPPQAVQPVSPPQTVQPVSPPPAALPPKPLPPKAGPHPEPKAAQPAAPVRETPRDTSREKERDKDNDRVRNTGRDKQAQQ